MVIGRRNKLYISAGSRIWEVTPDGLLYAFAGTGLPAGPQPAADPVPALSYGFSFASRIAIDGADNIYALDGPRVLRISPDGMLHRIPLAGLVENTLVEAVASDSAGNLVISLSQPNAGQIARVG